MNFADLSGPSVTGRFFAFLIVAFLSFITAVANAAENRVALVIGNASYNNAPLRNPINDARAVSDRLRGLGFEVLLKENVRVREIGGIYREFRNRIKPGGVALFFYAGHGIQFKGQNYLPAVDSNMEGEEEVPLQSINLNLLLDNMDDGKSAMNIVLLDACRDNPFARRFRGGARGLAQIDKASGTLIHYATRPGSVAADGTGQFGTYTEALLEHIEVPGVPIELMLKRVTNHVASVTRGQQEPWIEGSLRGDFFFRTEALASQSPAAALGDEKAWNETRLNGTQAAYNDFLLRFPASRFAENARHQLLRLSALTANPKQVPPLSTADSKLFKFNDEAGREWMVCASGAGKNRACPLSERPWSEVDSSLATHSADGWRLPTIAEMKSLAPMLSDHRDFAKTLGATRYWSADSIERIRDRMWGFSFDENMSYPMDKLQPNPIIFVRNSN